MNNIGCILYVLMYYVEKVKNLKLYKNLNVENIILI